MSARPSRILMIMPALFLLLPPRAGRAEAPPCYLSQWGVQGSGAGQFDGPQAAAVDDSGFVFVVDAGNNRIQKYTGAGAFISQWGSPGSGNGQFSNPYDVAFGISDDLTLQMRSTSGSSGSPAAVSSSPGGAARAPATDNSIFRSVSG